MEVGVASTKAFTAQLTDLLLLTILLGRRHGLDEAGEEKLVLALHHLESAIEQVLTLDAPIKNFPSVLLIAIMRFSSVVDLCSSRHGGSSQAQRNILHSC